MPGDSEKKTPSGKPRGFSWRGTAVFVTVCIVIAVLVRGFLIQMYMIPSGSMEPTLDVGDHIVVYRQSYLTHPPRRGDVVVFDGRGTFYPNRVQPTGLKAVGSEIGSWFGLANRNVYVVKRVIGVGGDHVRCCNAAGKIVVNGHPVAEPYIMPGNAPSASKFNVEVPAGHLWLMGDHRSDSADSRAHLGDPGGGMVPDSQVVGKVVLRIWPPDRFGSVDDGEPAGG